MDSETSQFTYETMFNCIPEGIMAIDKKKNIILFNERAMEITGWSDYEVIGKKCYEILQSSQCSIYCPAQKAMTELTNCYLSKVLIMTKEQRTIPTRFSIMPLKDKDGQVIGAAELFSDQRHMYPTYYGKFNELGLIGNSDQMREVYQLIEIVAETESNVLIFGKTGTGKELVANAVHKFGPRKDKPFIKINCAALSDTLLESELFGHERGAFTGAVNQRIGRFELAHEGTIFLDEISEISPRFQAKLLRVVQEGEFERVGSSKTIKVDVRIIVATNKDLCNLVRQNLFRDDLFYRLNVFPIYLPELKERKGDIQLLIDEFINEFNSRFKKQKNRLSDEALRFLMDYSFPGNVRELRNIIEHAFIKCPGSIIELEHFPNSLKEILHTKLKLANLVQKTEMGYIKQVLEQCGGNKSKTASILGISRKTLYNKLNS